MTWLDTGSFKGGKTGSSPLVRLDDVRLLRALDKSEQAQYPGMRSILVTRDGHLIPCQASIGTLRQRVLEDTPVDVAPMVRVVLQTEGLAPPTLKLKLGG